MQDLNLFSLFIDKLDEVKVRYFITGSVASIVYGEPRLTHDIDLVISLDPENIKEFINAFDISEFYCPPAEILNIELNRTLRGHFNIIHHKTGFKADIYFMGRDEFQFWAMNNKKQIDFLGKILFIAPIEYVIVKKLEYFQEGKSEKHILDIKGMIKESNELIDYAVLSELIKNRGLSHEWKLCKEDPSNPK
jgi:hypothetical protein